MTWKSPVVMIGIDAACWEVIDPHLASGRLPNLARLMEEGTWGPLRSLHYTSPALWTSISTGKLPGVRSVVKVGKNGLLARSGDVDDLATKLWQVLKDPELRESFAKRGRARVEARYAWHRIIPRLVEVYEQVLEAA